MVNDWEDAKVRSDFSSVPTDSNGFSCIMENSLLLFQNTITVHSL